ncbi:hypothetical protein Scep_023972 [Stephania cephalantha]|uniref:Uncharacterized protein n=1 Tax=Stephania cephalantha TaxID=152367 RepID=A0AAP0HWQ6_9MAGN
MVVAKGGSKAKLGTPKGKKPTDDTSTPFPGGLKNQTLLKDFNNHVAAAIWNEDNMGWFIDVYHPRVENASRRKAGMEDGDDIYDRVRRAVEVVTAWKALLHGVGDRASALQMANEVLKHLIIVGLSVTSSSTTSVASPS